MYTWDLTRIKHNLDYIKEKRPKVYNRMLKDYVEPISKYILMIENNKNTPLEDERYLFYRIIQNYLDFFNFYKINKDLFFKILDIKKLELKKEEVVLNHNFDVEEVVDISRHFLYDINTNMGEHFDSMIFDNKIVLNKTEETSAEFIPDSINNCHHIGVNSLNKEDMIYSLTHEFGHAYSKKISENNNRETLPILLELYLFDFLNYEYPKINRKQFINDRFVYRRNIEIDTIQSPLNFYKINKEEIIKTVTLKEDIGDIYSVNGCLDYFLSTEKALSIYSKTKSRHEEILKLLNEERYLFDLDSFIKVFDHNIVNANTNQIKKLMRK